MEINVDLITVENGTPKAISFDGKQYNLKPVIETEMPTQTYEKKVRYKRRRRRKPLKAHGWDKVYKKWIYKEDILAVKRAIIKVGYEYVPHTEAIVEETGFAINKTRSILHYMKDKQMIIGKRNGDKKTVYQMVN